MTTDTRTPAELRYDALKDGSAYEKPAPVIRIMADGTPNKYDTGEYSWAKAEQITPLGTLANGTPVQGLHDVDGSAHCARFETADGSVYAGDDGVLSGGWAGQTFEMTLDQVQAFRRLLAGDTLEQFMRIAVAWERGDAPPPPAARPCEAGDAPTQPPVTVGRIEPDLVDYPDVSPGTEFRCGNVLLEFLDDRQQEPFVYNLGRDCMPLAEAEQELRNFQTLLADPRVRAARDGRNQT